MSKFWILVIAILAIIHSITCFQPQSISKTRSGYVSMIFGGRGSQSTQSGEVIISITSDRADVRRAADFLSYAMYEDVPKAQRRELSELEAKDLRTRYEEKVGKSRLPSALILAKEDEEIIGSVGLDCQVFNKRTNKFRPLKKDEKLSDFLDRSNPQELVPVLANLAVRKDKRGLGLARTLLSSAEDIVKAWDYPVLYLLVDSQNVPAQKLYTSSGYKTAFTDEFATCVVSGQYNLQTQECINLCLTKRLSGTSASEAMPSSLGDIFNLFFKK
jgi:GNAT superfamily N-acetyltransferase